MAGQDRICLIHFFYLPNLFSLARIPLTCLAVLQLRPFNLGWFLFFAGLAILSDALDGLSARYLNQVTKLGIILDPLADKISMALAVAFLYYYDFIPAWLFGVIIIRDFLILGGSAYLLVNYRNLEVPSSNKWGKWAVTVIAVGLLLQILNWPWLDAVSSIVIILSAGISLVSYYNYFENIILYQNSLVKK